MADKKFPVHFANFVCHFGPYELLDFLEEIVVPAFLNGHVRTFKDGQYFFHSVEILNLGRKSQPEFAICGRFVKDMVVVSEQRYDSSTNRLVIDSKKMETAPSAIFVLLLASHKLIYLLETANAPGLESFRSTVSNFLAKARTNYLGDIYSRAETQSLTPSETGRFPVADQAGNFIRVTKTRLNELLPAADLEIVPLANDESLRAFVSRFKVLQTATMRLVKPNSELDNDDFLAAVREKSNAVGSETASLTYKNQDGLVKKYVVEQLEAAAAEGNTEIKLEGKDASGLALKGTNSEFKVVSYLTSKPVELLAAGRAMLSLFKAHLASGLIKLPKQEVNNANVEKLVFLTDQVTGGNDDSA